VHVYSVYGLGLHSEFPIPELLQSDAAPTDIEVRRGAVVVPDVPAAAKGEEEAGDSWSERHDDETLCVFAGVGRYRVRAGKYIEVDPEAGSDFSAVRHLLVGPVLAHLLWQRDVFALHASVVSVFGRQLGFVGVSGEGKSTIAAALEARGHVLVCDDVAAIVHRGAQLEVLPGFPRIRLHDDSLRSIGDTPSAHPPVHAYLDKRLKHVVSFAEHALRLDALFVLATGEALAIEPMASGAAVVEILRHTYYAHQFAPLYGFGLHLERASRIAAGVPSYRLTRPKDLTRLPELIGFLEAHARA
jgi:hypothetical protein